MRRSFKPEPMNQYVVAALVASCLLVGCKRRKNTVDAAPPPPDLTVAADPAGAADLDPAIRAAVQKYVATKRSAPRSWIDLTVEQGYLSTIPQGTDGRPLDFEKTMARLGIKVEK